jgi:cytochrome c
MKPSDSVPEEVGVGFRAHFLRGLMQPPKQASTTMGRLASYGGIVLTFGAILSWAADSVAEQSPSERRGLRFVGLNCARCHAIDKTGASPLANAPPFRTLHLKYAVSDLQRPLAQGVHPVMPIFHLEASQVEDILSYFKTLGP